MFKTTMTMTTDIRRDWFGADAARAIIVIPVDRKTHCSCL